MSDQRIEFYFKHPSTNERRTVALTLHDLDEDLYGAPLSQMLEQIIDTYQIVQLRGPIEVPPSREDGKCEWSYDEFHGKFDTKCGQGFCFEFSGVRENKFRFCPYCGSEIITRIEAR